MIDVSVLGLGYVGLPTAALIAKSGLKVNGVDINQRLISTLKNTTFDFEEPGLNTLVQEVLSSEMLIVSDTPVPSKFYIICVPTPVDIKNQPDCSYLFSAVDSIIDLLQAESIIILESTIPVGTTTKVSQYILSKRPDIDWSIELAHCPERVLPGNALNEIIYNNRIIGGTTPNSTKIVSKLYKQFTKGSITETTSSIAEFTKLAENTYRDINIAYANELSMIASSVNVDANEVIKLANMHPRVNIHKPGIGVGGHCIPVDPWFLVSDFPNTSKIIRTARDVNISKESWVVDRILDSVHSDINNIVLLGLSYKENVGDFRESPSIRIAQNLSQLSNVDIICVDPYFVEAQHNSLGNINIGSYKDITHESLVVLLVKHDSFQSKLDELENSNQFYLSF